MFKRIFSGVKIREGHDNFFTPLRILFALMVLVGHAFVVEQRNLDAEPFLLLHYKPSYIAVNLFFIASGFLVTRSMLYREDLADYIAARSLRIYPALIAFTLFVMFIMGPMVTSLSLREFLTHPDLLKQPFMVLSFWETEMAMPGALQGNDEQIAAAPLWTLRYEVLAYIGTGILFALGLLRKKWMLALQFMICASAWPLAQMTGLYDQVPATVQNILRFGICYSLGALIYAYQDKVSVSFFTILVLGVLTFALSQTPVLEVVFDMWLAAIVFWAAYINIPALNRLKTLPDTSYGIYIYHWAILQWLFYKNPTLSLVSLALLTLVLTVLAATTSWYVVEKPMLRKKQAFGNFLGRHPNPKPKKTAHEPDGPSSPDTLCEYKPPQAAE